MSARWLFTAALGAAILSPLVRARGWDSFPISSFPMFSRGNLGTRVWMGHVILVDEDGRRRPAPPSVVGSPEPMVAKNLVENALARDEAYGLCMAIGGRAPPGVAKIEIVTSVFDTSRYFTDPTPVERTVHTTCNAWR
jgi:hypothetical protein